MNRKLLIAIGLVMLGTMFLLANCADPLEGTGPNLTPEPIYEIDTVNMIDTVMRYDTVRMIDTIYTGDTLTRVDTVMIVDTVKVGGGKNTDTLYVVDTVVTVDTVRQIDTLIRVDSVIAVDTVTFYDTVFVTDTVTQIDTVIVVMPDTGAFHPFCGTIASNQQSIVWMFRNPEGDFRLEFSATLERIQPGQTLTLDIDGQTFLWDPVANPAYLSELHLKQYSTIRIVANKPPARGHSIYVCLQVTAL